MGGRRALRRTLIIMAGLVVLAATLQVHYPRFLAARWRNRLQTVPDDRAAVLLEGAARLGDPGIPVLVEALGSDRERVAAAGKRVLHKELERWETLRAREYSPKVAILAKALADRVDGLAPTARADAASLASRILRLWTLDDAVVDPTQVIACCEKVLRATGQPAPRLPEALTPGEPPLDQLANGAPAGRDPADGRGDRRPGLRAPRDVEAGFGSPLRGVSELPGGGLRVGELASPGSPAASAPDLSDAPRVAEARADEPRRLDDRGPSRPLEQPMRPLSEPDAPRAIPKRPRPQDSGARPMESTDRQAAAPLGFLDGTPAPAGDRRDGGRALGRWAGRETVELMRRLQSPDEATVAQAQAELARRGFTETHLALARQLFDPDPKIRAGLARLVLELPGFPATPWLLQLSRDESAEVRRSAIALLATTGDPALVERIEEIARGDPDPHVQRQAERIARRRRGTRR
jgi:hypothetical protein